MTDPVQHVAWARRGLARARHMLAGGFPERAGRNAYLAAYHAALAFIVDRGVKEPKTHNGTRAEFARLVQDDTRIPSSYAAFLARAYDLKTIADYAGNQVVTPEDAAAALATATDLVEIMAALVQAPDAEPG